MNTAQPPHSSHAIGTPAELPSPPAEPIDAVAALLASLGVRARPLRRVLALLAEGPRPLEELVRRPAVPRRSVEELLTAAGSDVERAQEGYRLVPSARTAYRERFALDELHRRSSSTGEPPREELEHLREFIAAGPKPSTALDHVTATAESVLARAEWMRENYDLGGAHVLCLGDHDLTSIAVAMAMPSAVVTVVDLDERVLAHIDSVAAEHGLAIRTLHADLRFGLPPAVAGRADLVFTDPPYTPEGIGLFTARAAECLTGRHGRVLIAYGYSDRSPALGHKVQSELLRLGMVFEAILPAFHRYSGAQAIGSASDLYVCQPTSQTRRLALKQAGIYTHGPQSVESARAELSADFLRVVGERLGAEVDPLREPGWAGPLPARRAPSAFDLRADPGPWLLRMLLACNDERVGFVVSNNHPDIVDEAAQRSLSELLAAKYSLRFHRSTPDSRHCVVVASGAGASGQGQAAGPLLRRAHGKLGNTWREALISAASERGATLTKRAAKERVAERVPRSGDLDLRLIDVPRHRLGALIRAASL